MRLLRCTFCDPPVEFDDYLDWFTHKWINGHYAIRRREDDQPE